MSNQINICIMHHRLVVSHLMCGIFFGTEQQQLFKSKKLIAALSYDDVIIDSNHWLCFISYI